jgi:hypothetical protein
VTKEPASKGALVSVISGGAPKAGGLAADLSEDPKPEGPAISYGGPPGAMPEKNEYGDHSFRAVAKAFGIPAERHASAQAALKQYIQSCLSESEPDEEF